MSAVIERTKQFYQKVIILELALLVSLSLLMFFALSAVHSISFLFGGMSSFLPQCLFVFWVFFRKKSQEGNKIGVFYRGEGLKWLATILLIVVVLQGVSGLDIPLFFGGYFLFLLCNSLLPLFLKQR